MDAVILRFAARVNGLSGIAVTRLDILDPLEEIRICTHYIYRGTRLEHFPSDVKVLAECQPVYETMPGWRAPPATCGDGRTCRRTLKGTWTEFRS